MEDQYEKFEISQWDLDNEFNPNRVRRHMTKEEQTYGVFFNDDSDDDRPSFSGATKSSQGINFVSGGIKGEKRKSEDEEEELDERPSFGTKKRKFHSTPAPDKNIGDWEKYTKGIGQKLLLQMGYVRGKGLGKDLQGITTPVEAKVRKGKGALGLYGPEVSSTRPKRADEIEKESKNSELTKQLHQWKKKDVKKDVKYSYKTLKDLNEEHPSKSNQGEFNSIKVIDMTGPTQKVYSGYHQIHQQHTRPEESETPQNTGKNFALPELEHNLNLLVNLTEQEIININHKSKTHKDRLVILQYEEENLAEVLDKEKDQITRVETILLLIDNLKEVSNLNEAKQILNKIKNEFYEEYKIYKLSDLAISVVFPLMQKYFEDWEALRNPTYGIEVLKSWKNLLETETKPSEMNPYQQLLWEMWMPPLRKAVLNWSPHECGPMVDLIEKWALLLPRWMLENILDQLIFPRLNSKVEDWNPLVDIVPIHSWIHPWLPLMKNKLEPLYSPIRQKIANALKNWMPNDDSAKLILEPWKTVFSAGTMEAFIVTNIVPKLSQALLHYDINPRAQQFDKWNCVFKWESFVSTQTLLSLFEKNFFPRWMHVLCTWLSHNPEMKEVTEWFTGWKALFNSKFNNHPAIKEFFNRAASYISKASTFSDSSTNVFNFYENAPKKSTPREYESKPSSLSAPASSGVIRYKEVLEKKALENNVIFMPIPNRHYESKQIYRFGSKILYLDKSVIFVNNEKTWVPTSLQSLLDMSG